MEMSNEIVLLVSPHCDDACFSLGASILKNSDKEIIIWDIFTVQSYTILKDDAEVAKKRIIKEEKTFQKKTGTSIIMEGLLDAYLRGYKRLSSILLSNIEQIMALNSDKKVYEDILDGFERVYSEIKPDFIGLPLGCGAHIDHLIVREAGLCILKKMKELDKKNIFFYEELPYSLNKRWLNNVLKEFEIRGINLKPHYLPVDGYLYKKYELVNLYKSQIKKEESERLIEYARELREGSANERIWLISEETNDGCDINCAL